MKGDFTRFSHNPDKHYSGVLKQQGRVDLDADWNEHVQIRDYINRIETQDTIGRCGVPNSAADSFKIVRAGGNLQVLPGRIYVRGILCESGDTVTLTNPPVNGPHVYLAYIDVWQRHITAIEDPGLPEIALGGVDTTTRIKTEWKVRLRDVSEEKGVDAEHLDCQPFCKPPWEPPETISTGTLKAWAKKAEETGLCEVEARAGYRGLENRLYRVEIHRGGTVNAGGAGPATFKWSRDNGSVVFPISLPVTVQGSKSTITLKYPGKDEALSLHVGDWVEVLDDSNELDGAPGFTAQIAPEADGTDLSKGVIVLGVAVNGLTENEYPRVRRWDQTATSAISLEIDGSIKVATTKDFELEDGLMVRFAAGTYQPGDYWTIPARSRIRDVIWPKNGSNPISLPREGIQHYYCCLALIIFKGGVWDDPKDCRHIFPPLTELRPGGCCLSVRPGENLQQAIDTVVGAGGGCICVCAGIHQIHGPLMLHNAQHLAIYGENAGTMLDFQDTDKDGRGGILLYGCSDVRLQGMLLDGEGLPALITTITDGKQGRNRGITLRDLVVFNYPGGGGEREAKCGIKLADAFDITIEDCRIVADNGILSLFGNSLPDKPEISSSEKTTPLNYGAGVNRLRMKDVVILYRDYGIWSLKSVRWNLSGCDIHYLPEKTLAYAKEAGYRNVFDLVEQLTSLARGPGGRSAIEAFIWDECTVDRCRLSGSVGMSIWAWVGGSATDNDFDTGEGSLGTVWSHNVRLSENRLSCGGGTGFAFVGSYRTVFSGNRVRGADSAVQNITSFNLASNLRKLLSQITLAYGIAPDKQKDYEVPALWVLMEETCRDIGLRQLQSQVQDFLDAAGVYQQVPVMFLASNYLYASLMESKSMARIPSPIIGLRIEGNDLEATDYVIRLQNFLPLAGLGITDNRAHTLTGQAIQVKATPVAANPQLIFYGWRWLLKELPVLFKALAAKISPGIKGTGGTGAANTKANLTDLAAKMAVTLGEVLSNLEKLSETVLDADYRIENNSIRSRQTAIESNIFQLAIQNNNITLEESPVSDEEMGKIIEVMDKYDATKPIATGLSQGSKGEVMAYSMAPPPGAPSGPATMPEGVVEASYKLNVVTSDPALKNKSKELNLAAAESDPVKVNKITGELLDKLASYVDSCGIWVKGAGCRIVGNQVVVPEDVDPNTWARGGIRFWDDEGTPVWLWVFLIDLIKLYKPGMQVPSLLTVTETLIDNNEINRGLGHGVEIGGIRNMPLHLGLADLKIRGNEIRDMASAGIMFREESLTIGMDIECNRIADCGSLVRSWVAPDQKGGIIVRNAASCRIHGNRVKCTSDLARHIGLFGIDLRSIYGLTILDNHVEHSEASGYKLDAMFTLFKNAGPSNVLADFSAFNLCGALRLSEIRGEVGIHDNVFQVAAGSGLLFGDIFSQDAWKEWMDQIVKNADLFKMPWSTSSAPPSSSATPAAGQTGRPNASIQANRFEALLGQPFLAFLVANLGDLNFSGNNVRPGTPGAAPGMIHSIGLCLLANNRLDSLQAPNLGGGIISSNILNQAITPLPLPGVTLGPNIP